MSEKISLDSSVYTAENRYLCSLETINSLTL